MTASDHAGPAGSLPGRLFALAEMLQGRGRTTVPELAARLGVSERTVRRDLLRLQDLGLPVDTYPGRGGGVSLPAGALLPALRFTDDELLALAVGLKRAADAGDPNLSRAARRGLERLEAVLTPATRERFLALQEALVPVDESKAWAVPVPSERILELVEAAHGGRRLEITHQRDGSFMRRIVDPYGVVRIGAWYLVAWCHLRGDVRTFRIDRVGAVRVTQESFVRPAGFDTYRAAASAIAMAPGHGEVLCRAWLDTDLGSASSMVPLTAVVLEALPGGVRLTARTRPDDLERIVFHLLRLPCAVRIEGPPELLAAARAVAGRAGELTELPAVGPEQRT